MIRQDAVTYEYRARSMWRLLGKSALPLEDIPPQTFAHPVLVFKRTMRPRLNPPSQNEFRHKSPAVLSPNEGGRYNSVTHYTFFHYIFLAMSKDSFCAICYLFC